MRTFLALGLSIAGVTALCLVGSAASTGCSAGSFAEDGDGGEGGIGPGQDGAPSDAPFSDSAPTDGPTSDSGFTCAKLGGNYDSLKTCNSVADCTTIARQCYCGSQPIIGIAKSALATANACEQMAGSQCALGCANFPGHQAEDGASDEDGGTIDVLCDNNRCHTVLR